MIELYVLAAGIVFGWIIGHAAGWDAAQRPRFAARRPRLVFARANQRLGSLGNVRRAPGAQDGRAGSAAAVSDPPPKQSATGEAPAPALSHEKRQAIPRVL